jgi:hypothetical protein
MMEEYDREGKPISLHEFCRLLGNEEYKRVAETQVGPYWISTVWLGINHNFSRTGPPIIFETMVFATGPDVDGLGPDMDCYRWSTEAEALAGHEEVVTLVRATTQETFDEPAPRNEDA